MKNISKETNIQKNTDAGSGDETNISVGDGKEIRGSMVCKMTARKIVVPRLVLIMIRKQKKSGNFLKIRIA